MGNEAHKYSSFYKVTTTHAAGMSHACLPYMGVAWEGDRLKTGTGERFSVDDTLDRDWFDDCCFPINGKVIGISGQGRMRRVWLRGECHGSCNELIFSTRGQRERKRNLALFGETGRVHDGRYKWPTGSFGAAIALFGGDCRPKH